MRLREEALLPGQRGGLLPAMKAGEKAFSPRGRPSPRKPPRASSPPPPRGSRGPGHARAGRGREREGQREGPQARLPGGLEGGARPHLLHSTVSLFQIQSGRTATARGAGVVARRRSVDHTPHTFDSETPPDTRARIMVHACNLDGHNSYRSSRGLSNSRCHGAAATAHEVALRSERTPEKTRPSSVPGWSRSARG
jgi:hypothetical protein